MGNEIYNPLQKELDALDKEDQMQRYRMTPEQYDAIMASRRNAFDKKRRKNESKTNNS